MAQIDPTAIVSDQAALAADVVVEAFAIVGPQVVLGSGCRVGPYSRIEGPTTAGERNVFTAYCSIGSPPQDLKYHGERTELVIGNDNVFREFVTINRGTVGGGGVTRIASNNFFMAYAHVAHDCIVGSNTIFANNATLAGHVEIADFVTVGAFSAVHQFCRVGEHAFIGGGSMITQDVMPYAKTVASRDNRSYGINSIGLQRKGFSKETIDALNKAYRILIRSKLRQDDALMKIEAELSNYPEARYLVEFVRASKRGIVR